ncbi:hypothetical protein APHAL10511_005500 [Amanita phalloides]|nr:hypothetical protein APHAL10511_005500 [Amanita phalloides]
MFKSQSYVPHMRHVRSSRQRRIIMTNYKGTLEGRGGDYLKGTFVAPEFKHLFLGKFDVDLSLFLARRVEYANFPTGPEQYSFTGHVGPTDLYLQLDDYPTATVTGNLNYAFEDRVDVKGTFTYRLCSM